MLSFHPDGTTALKHRGLPKKIPNGFYNGMIQRHQCIEVQVNAYLSALLEDEPDYRPLLLTVSA